MQSVTVALVTSTVKYAKLVMLFQPEYITNSEEDSTIEIFELLRFNLLSASSLCRFADLLLKGRFKRCSGQTVLILHELNSVDEFSIVVEFVNLINSYFIYPPFAIGFENLSTRRPECYQ